MERFVRGGLPVAFLDFRVAGAIEPSWKIGAYWPVNVNPAKFVQIVYGVPPYGPTVPRWAQDPLGSSLSGSLT